MLKILDELLSLFPAGDVNETSLLEFASKAGLDEKECEELVQMFMLIDGTSEKIAKLEEHRSKGGTLKTFVAEELDSLSEKHKFDEGQHEALYDAFKKASETSARQVIEEE